ncbi:hypothetical protein C8256_04595 [Kluyvera genomosp. 2]|uniref:Uncharacterized protein n=1 Tax=Kluyvera genomosp. 2 TaxID=2774054 RepID=A0A2T2Y500_9ENTR|nr:hypothetical protein C8256_04595 [Kluyvera genomosp. 2]
MQQRSHFHTEENPLICPGISLFLALFVAHRLCYVLVKTCQATYYHDALCFLHFAICRTFARELERHR